jgi:predicted nucleic acid-binding protein
MVDSSVWIDYFNGRVTAETDALHKVSKALIVVGDLITVEVLQGFPLERDFRIAQRVLAALEFRRMCSRAIAVAAARNYRALRARGVTPRSSIDTIIASFCIVEGHELLHSDRDFNPFERHLGLRVVRV